MSEQNVEVVQRTFEAGDAPLAAGLGTLHGSLRLLESRGQRGDPLRVLRPRAGGRASHGEGGARYAVPGAQERLQPRVCGVGEAAAGSPSAAPTGRRMSLGASRDRLEGAVRRTSCTGPPGRQPRSDRKGHALVAAWDHGRRRNPKGKMSTVSIPQRARRGLCVVCVVALGSLAVSAAAASADSVVGTGVSGPPPCPVQRRRAERAKLARIQAAPWCAALFRRPATCSTCKETWPCSRWRRPNWIGGGQDHGWWSYWWRPRGGDPQNDELIVTLHADRPAHRP